MAKLELTDRFCAKAKPLPGEERTPYTDTIVPGLCFLVGARSKVWYLLYSVRGQRKRQRMWLGTYPEMSLAEARKRAREARGEVGQGIDPLVEKRAETASLVVRNVVEDYIFRAIAENRTREATARRLRKNISAVIGDVKLSQLHRRDFSRCIDAIMDRGAPTEAARVYEDARALNRWAKGRGVFDENYMEGMPRPSEPKVRDRVLDATEIAAFWSRLGETDMSESTRRILRLCLILGARVGEVCGMTRAELDLDSRVWTIPGSRVKNATEHRLPLSDMTVTIIRDQIAAIDEAERRRAQRQKRTFTGRDESGFIFPGPGGRAAMAGHAIAKATKRNEETFGIPAWTPHDLRRSMATHLQELGVQPIVIGAILNHLSITRATITTKVYATYTYAKEMQAALELWADRLAGIVSGEGAAVVPMARRA